MTVSIFIKCLDVSELDCPRVSPCFVLIWMYPRIIRGNFVKDCPNNIQFNPNNCLNIPLLGKKILGKNLLPDWISVSNPSQLVKFYFWVLFSILAMRFSLKVDAYIYIKLCICMQQSADWPCSQCNASAVHHISPATGLPEHPRVNIFY